MSNPTPHFTPAPQPAETRTPLSADDPVHVAVASRAESRPRLWPGVVIVALVWLVVTVPSWVAPATMVQFMAMLWGRSSGQPPSAVDVDLPVGQIGDPF